jgi:hypothetical protein
MPDKRTNRTSADQRIHLSGNPTYQDLEQSRGIKDSCVTGRQSTMGFWHFAEIIIGAFCVLLGLSGFLLKRFPPLGWTTQLIWGEKGIPAWIAGPFYFILGLLMLYWGFTGK